MKFQVYLFNHTIPDASFKFISQAIRYGKEQDCKFIIKLGDIICYKRRDFTPEYKEWYQNQQVEYQRRLGE